jgi:hypothetical protein
VLHTESIRTTVQCACFAALALSLAEGILPLERFGKQLKLLTAILMLTAILRPLLRLPQSDFDTGRAKAGAETDEITYNLRQAQESAVAQSICTALNQALQEKKVRCRVVSCAVHIGDDGCISISEVEITGNTQTGTVYLREWLGAETAIREGGDGQ